MLSHCGFICIAVLISDTEYLFMYLLPFGYLLWGIVYSSHLPIFYLDFLVVVVVGFWKFAQS